MRFEIINFDRKHKNANSMKINDFVMIFMSNLYAETATGAYVIAIFVFSNKKIKKDNMRKMIKN